jgi:hypothetical protein
VALFFTRTYNRLLRPGLSELMPRDLPPNTPLQQAFVRLEQAIATHVAQSLKTAA